MKKLAAFLLIFSLTIPTAFANDEDVIPVDAFAKFGNQGQLMLYWDDSEESDLDYFELYKSEEDSTPRDESLLRGKNANDYTDNDPGSGVSFYQMCTYTILSTEACDEVIAIFAPDNLILDPIVDEFIDIDGHWAFNYIEKLRVLNVVQGDGEGNFEPNRNVNRAEAIKIIMLAFRIGGISCHSEYFPDMSSADWFCDVVSKAYQDGYVQGDDGQLFPGRDLTRAEGVKIVLEIMGIEVPDITEMPFADVEIDKWYAKYIAKAKELNIVQGVGEGDFEPNRSITRAELSKIAAEAANL